jgi:hypothetical protein
MVVTQTMDYHGDLGPPLSYLSSRDALTMKPNDLVLHTKTVHQKRISTLLPGCTHDGGAGLESSGARSRFA